MGAREFLKSMGSVIRLAKKSDKEQFMLYLKLVLMGVALVGTIGFIVKFISTVLPSVFG